jgi:Ser-tRNA(Ala) deacylase AlaX
MSEIYPRQHSAEHILTAVVGKLFGGKIIDSRFKINRVRCDYEIHSDASLPENHTTH